MMALSNLGEDGSRQELGEDVTQLALSQGDVVNGELFIDDAVTQLHEPDREVFASTAVVARSRWEQSFLVVAEDAGAAEGPPSKLSMDSTKVNPLLRAAARGDELHLGC